MAGNNVQIRFCKRPYISMLIRYDQGSSAFRKEENISQQEKVPLVQLTHRIDIDTPIALHKK